MQDWAILDTDALSQRSFIGADKVLTKAVYEGSTDDLETVS